MKHSISFFAILILFSLPCRAQQGDFNQTTTDPYTGKLMLVGKCSREGLEGDLFGAFFKKSHDAYLPDKDTVELLRKKTSGVSVVIVMATWCEDSQLQVPRFFKILDAMDRFGNYSIICVNRDRKAAGVVLDNIQNVPTIIIRRDGKELGRIIEKPVRSLESDFLGLLTL